jgi:hypothetical protein
VQIQQLVLIVYQNIIFQVGFVPFAHHLAPYVLIQPIAFLA